MSHWACVVMSRVVACWGGGILRVLPELLQPTGAFPPSPPGCLPTGSSRGVVAPPGWGGLCCAAPVSSLWVGRTSFALHLGDGGHAPCHLRDRGAGVGPRGATLLLPSVTYPRGHWLLRMSWLVPFLFPVAPGVGGAPALTGSVAGRGLAWLHGSYWDWGTIKSTGGGS